MKNKPIGKTQFSIKSRLMSVVYALKGVRYLFVSQHNAWIHLVAIVIVVVGGILLCISRIEWCFIVLSIAVVLSAEAANTAIEELTNKVSPEFNLVAGRVKDLGAAAVLFCAIGAAVVGAFVFVPRLALLF